MRRFTIPIISIAVLLFAINLEGQLPASQGWCETGAQTVTIRGAVPGSPQVQASYPSCTVSVYAAGTQNLVSIFSDASGQTPLANPFTASSTGQWSFYAPCGAYDVTLSGAGLPNPVTLAGSALFAPSCSSHGGVVYAASYDFPTLTVNTALTANSAITITPPWSALPPGIIAGDTLYIATAPVEVITLTNVGTACPAGSPLSICFTPANTHASGWLLESATNGIQEAINAAGSGGWVIDNLQSASIETPVVIVNPLRFTGFIASTITGNPGTTINQLASNTDVLQLGRSTGPDTSHDIGIENILLNGAGAGTGGNTNAGVHILHSANDFFTDVKASNNAYGIWFDSTNAMGGWDSDVRASHFIDNYIGVYIQGGSANRLTFIGDTVDHNTYGVFDDGGWDHTWLGSDIEYNTDFGYWQEVSQPGSYSGHNVVLHGDYFENNGSIAGQGDVFLGQLVSGGSGNNGAGCINCEITGNLFNATNGLVTAVNLGAVMATISDNTYSGYTPANVYASITGPDPNFTRALLIGDCGTITASVQCSQSGPNSITQLGYGALTIGGNDQLVDQGGTEFRDTTIESPTGIVRFRGKPGGETTSNPAQIQLDGNSSSSKEDFINFANANILYWRISTDIGGDGADDFCFALNLTNPSSGQCQAYIGPNWHFQFSGINNAPSGSISPAGDFTFKQMANGDSAIMILRNTDTSPTGYLLDIDDATDSHPLFRVDALGNTTVNATLTANVIQNNCSGVSAQMSAGTVTILNTCLTAGRPILLNEASKSGVQGILSYVLTSGQIIISSSSSLDTSTVAWSQQ